MRFTRFSWVLTLLALACGDSDKNEPAMPTLTVALSQPTVSIEPSATRTVTATIAKTHLDGVDVTLALSGAPAGVTVSADTTVPAETAVITIAAGVDTALGSHDVTVTATAGDVVTTVTLTINVAYGVSERTGRVSAGGSGVPGLAVSVWGDGDTSPTQVTTGADGSFTVPNLRAPYDVAYVAAPIQAFFPKVVGTNHTFFYNLNAAAEPKHTLNVAVNQPTPHPTFCVAYTDTKSWSGYDPDGASIVIDLLYAEGAVSTVHLTCLAVVADDSGHVTSYRGYSVSDVVMQTSGDTATTLALGDTETSAVDVTVSVTGESSEQSQVLHALLIGGSSITLTSCTTTPCTLKIPNVPALASAVQALNGQVGIRTVRQALDPTSSTATVQLPAIPVVVAPTQGATVAHDGQIVFQNAGVMHFASLQSDDHAFMIGTPQTTVDIARIEQRFGALSGAQSLTLYELPLIADYTLERALLLSPKGDLALATIIPVSFTLAE